MQKDIIDIAKDIKKIVELDLTDDTEVTNSMVAAYIEAIGYNLSEDAFQDDPLNAKRLPQSTVVEWLYDNVLEFMQGKGVVEYVSTII